VCPELGLVSPQSGELVAGGLILWAENLPNTLISPAGTRWATSGLGSSLGWADPEETLAMADVTNGVRHTAENRRRMNVVADAVRTAFGAP